ncbi:hypothetical protein F9L07_10860 [Pimelobacter simplex]|uniref:Uncharacterized protein n=1 Tax=Nocardioides simplex TaxID=2045 RepID=A0A7J5E212_NOCSI|nr:hypothetical protein [Pimelobacter simplex]KAB2812285.1 hypothetical protein F9L07_10860 [Pimelobacter simplex]
MGKSLAAAEGSGRATGLGEIALKRLVTVVLVGVLAGFVLPAIAPPAAHAAFDCSTKTSFTSNSVSYLNHSCISSAPTYASAVVDRKSHGKAPVGRIGVRARAYWSNGTLCERSATRYNTSEVTFFSVAFDHGCGGYVYSQGFSETWNGNGYKRVGTTRTVNLFY